MAPKRKLIEVALPLEAINRESAREKEPFTRDHPRSLHIWWARRPAVAARAILFAQLVDDPSANPDQFPTEESQVKERERLLLLISRLVVWEDSNNPELLLEARKEIFKSTGGTPPAILDPFAGGGTIPLEAQRLGLEAHASDLNPVAVLINKALIEFPPKFRGLTPVYPGLADSEMTNWLEARGLAADVRAYGQWMCDEAEKRLGHLYPQATLSDGTRAAVIAWIWARTVVCPNPACGIEMPLVRSWWLSKKKGKGAFVVPEIVVDPTHPSGRRVEFSIGNDIRNAPTPESDGTVGRNGARCLVCQTAIDLKYVRSEGRSNRLSETLMAVVAEGNRSRVYLEPTAQHRDAARVARPRDVPDQSIPPQAPSFRVQAYGMATWADLFTNRQLAALTTFGDLVGEVRQRALTDALASGRQDGLGLDQGGVGAQAYADAISIYTAIAISRFADMSNSICSWNSVNENIRALFSRQAVPMTWDFAEVNPLGSISPAGSIKAAAAAIRDWGSPIGEAVQADASARDFRDFVVSTDPPYYDNIGYSDLSDFFYVWQRRSLRHILPSLYGTLLVPKAEELVANQYRHGGKAGAKAFFESGFQEVFRKARESASHDYPMTVYYAFKQSESSTDGQSSTGWETLLEGMLTGGWTVTATWPLRSERVSRSVSLGTNALASSIVLALRPRPDDAPTTDRRGLIAALKRELGGALRTLQYGGVAPVDLPQAAIGPGMAVFSRYASVIESDGTPMTVRSALARINEILDEVLGEQEGDFDPTTRFAIAWYREFGYQQGAFGDADNMARARNTAVTTMERDGILSSRAGKVKLFGPVDLDDSYDVTTDAHTSAWEALHHTIRVVEGSGVPSAGEFLHLASQRPDGAVDLDLVKGARVSPIPDR
ncbi:DUF1156 domain-containing protein [Cryobacterium breve]|uniref:DUF1156 domain-containing protein n=1 Tax=Cryobacterium breve TaxID=1259258 RepID=A0ABY7NBG9_9MICO|nr:DUF1156 domain-containing protein [Cryobacterium breve]WBM79845.1 DUF1156 domain-containing protein [Cryobacterium breve]